MACINMATSIAVAPQAARRPHALLFLSCSKTQSASKKISAPSVDAVIDFILCEKTEKGTRFSLAMIAVPKSQRTCSCNAVSSAALA